MIHMSEFVKGASFPFFTLVSYNTFIHIYKKLSTHGRKYCCELFRLQKYTKQVTWLNTCGPFLITMRKWTRWMIISLMLLTRPDAVTTTVCWRAVTCVCVCVSSSKMTPQVKRGVQTSDPRCRGPCISSLLTGPGLPWLDENNTCNQSLLFVWSGVIKSVSWLTQ